VGDGGAPLDVVTFGCRLNAYESDAIRAQAAADGVTDAVIFNTCAVTAAGRAAGGHRLRGSDRPRRLRRHA